MLNQNASVLIVGAGPIGLTAACYLQRLGVSFDIIDQKSGPVDDSRALGVHARTLEFMQMFGLDKSFIEQGNITRFMTFHRYKKLLFKLDFATIGDLTDFPFMLVLPQSRTERILLGYLEDKGVSVQWQSALENIHELDDAVQCQLRNHDVTTEHRYDYIIAADGAGSRIRNQLDIPFEGQTYDARFLLSEVNIQNNAIPRNSSHVYMGKTTTVAVLPQPDNVYRIVGPDFQTVAGGESIVGGTDMSFASFQQFLSRESLLKHVEIENASRLVNYRIHKRVARSFQTERIFLCGDAAHVHSPAGGQGMNTGIHDVMNLGWKLAAVIKGVAKPELLRSYQVERAPAVRAVVNGADKAMLKVVNRSWWWRILLDKLAPILTRFYQPKHLLATMAQLTWSYAHNQIESQTDLLQPGYRVPNLALTNGQTLHQILGQTAQPVCLVSGADLSPNTQVEQIARHSNEATGKIPATHYVLVNPIMHSRKPFVGCLLVRPDGYLLASIPYQTTATSSQWLEALLPNVTAAS